MAEQVQDTEQQEQPARKRKGLVVGGIVLAIMVVEGGAIFLAMRFLGAGPEVAAAGTLGLADEFAGAEAPPQEIHIVDFKAYNKKDDGRVFVYRVRVFGRVRPANADRVRELVKLRQVTLQDRLSAIVRAADPAQLQEANLETVRRQIKFEVGRVLGDDTLVEEILLPEWMAYRADY